MLQICRNIKQARLSTGKSQEEIAKKINVSRSTYKNWEENTEPDLANLKTIAEALGVQPYVLLKGVIDFDETNKSGPIQEPDLLTRMKTEIHTMQLSLDQLSKDVLMIPDSDKIKGRRVKQDLALHKKERSLKNKRNNLFETDN